MARLFFRVAVMAALVFVCLDLSARICSILVDGRVISHLDLAGAERVGRVIALVFALVVGWAMTRRDDAVTRCERSVERFNSYT